ncbi:MAG: hypothetical protein JXB49_30820 [Bacteroidales bacterium]|nr:hypothetical protein [Bacteroidales bacterium]
MNILFLHDYNSIYPDIETKHEIYSGYVELLLNAEKENSYVDIGLGLGMNMWPFSDYFIDISVTAGFLFAFIKKKEVSWGLDLGLNYTFFIHTIVERNINFVLKIGTYLRLKKSHWEIFMLTYNPLDIRVIFIGLQYKFEVFPEVGVK